MREEESKFGRQPGTEERSGLGGHHRLTGHKAKGTEIQKREVVVCATNIQSSDVNFTFEAAPYPIQRRVTFISKYPAFPPLPAIRVRSTEHFRTSVEQYVSINELLQSEREFVS